MQTVHLVQPSSKGRVKYITLVLEGDTVSRTWGLIGCKSQSTSNTYVAINQGKSNELTPEMAAEADFSRIISDKVKEGYKQTDSLETGKTEASLDTFDFDSPPTSFAPAKPIKEIEDNRLARLLGQKIACPTLKENGLRHFIFKGTTGKVTIYTRRMDDHTNKYPHVVQAVKDLPNCSLLDIELVVDPLLAIEQNLGHTAAFNLMQGISKSDTNGGKLKANLDRTMELQRATPVRGLVFDILYWDGKTMWDQPYSARLNLINQHYQSIQQKQTLFCPTVLNFNSVQEVDAWVKTNQRRYEGLVIWDLTSTSEVVFTGKPKRKGCYKRKAVLETEVIATGFEPGTGENQNKIGAFLIAQMDLNGKMIDVGKCGAGLTDADRDPSKWTFPLVICIEYANRFPTGKYQFPTFTGVSDKRIEEADRFVPEED